MEVSFGIDGDGGCDLGLDAFDGWAIEVHRFVGWWCFRIVRVWIDHLAFKSTRIARDNHADKAKIGQGWLKTL